MRFLPTLVIASAVAMLTAACVPDPVTAMNVQGCIKKNCDEHEATAYQACETSCRQRYGK